MICTLIGAESRTFAFRHGIQIDGCSPENAPALPETPKLLPTKRQFLFTVPYSFIDLNGHMNNARYFDLAEDHLPPAAEGRPLRSVSVEYSHEARLGETLSVSVGEENGVFTFAGMSSRPVFRMRLAYGQAP